VDSRSPVAGDLAADIVAAGHSSHPEEDLEDHRNLVVDKAAGIPAVGTGRHLGDSHRPDMVPLDCREKCERALERRGQDCCIEEELPRAHRTFATW